MVLAPETLFVIPLFFSCRVLGQVLGAWLAPRRPVAPTVLVVVVVSGGVAPLRGG